MERSDVSPQEIRLLSPTSRIGADRIEVVGRAEVAQRIAASAARLTLVTGDSGIGKSTVLAAAIARAGSELGLAPLPVRVRHAPGALQRALLESLALVVAEITVDSSAAERLRTVVQRVVDRVAEGTLKGLAKAIGRQLIGIVRSRVSDVAGEVLEQVAAELTTPDDAMLQARITNAADSDVVDLIAALSQEALKLVGDRAISLTLDDVDNLGEDDLRHLADLASHAPEGLRIWAGFATWDAESRTSADQLVEAGAVQVELSPLTEDEVAMLVEQASLDKRLAPGVHRVTNGYPLYVLDAVALLSKGTGTGELSALQPRDVLVRRTHRSWRALDPATQTAAMLLAAFSDALPAAQVPTYLRISPPAWATIEARLQDASIFTGVNEPPWFHELRRRCLWGEILTPAQRSEAANRALEYLEEHVSSGAVLASDLVQYARIAPHASLSETDAKIAALLAASTEEVAVAAALMELVEPQSGQESANAEFCLLHARETYGATGDLRQALKSLADRGLLVQASNERVVVVVPFWGGVRSALLLAGRAAAELGRLPVPSAASHLFESAIRARVEPFRSAGFGVGEPSIAELSEQAKRLQQRHADGSTHIGPQGPNLLVRAHHGELPLYASFVFDDAAERDRALVNLSGYEPEVLGQPLRFDDVLAHPLTVVPSLRFALAVGRVLGKNLLPISLASGREDLSEALSVEAEAAWRVDFIAAIRDLCTTEELRAYQLEHSRGLLFYETDEGAAIVDVVGGSGIERLSRAPTIQAPFARFDIALEAGLLSGERIGRISVRSGRPGTRNPVIEELQELCQRAGSFNTTQTRAKVVLTEEGLSRLLADAVERQLTDARALRSILSRHMAVRDPTGVTTCLLLKLDEPRPSFVPGADSMAMAVSVPNDSGRDEVLIRIVEDLPPGNDRPESVAELRDLIGGRADLSAAHRWSYGLARKMLGELLGFDWNEVTFAYHAEEPAL